MREGGKEGGRETGRRAGRRKGGRQAERERQKEIEGGESGEGETVLVRAGGPPTRRMLMRGRRCIGQRAHPRPPPPPHHATALPRQPLGTGVHGDTAERQGDLGRRPWSWGRGLQR